MSEDRPLYREVQGGGLWWAWLIVLLVAAVAWWLFVEQLVLGHPLGTDPLPDWGAWIVWALVGLGLPSLVLSMRLVTEVSSQGVAIRFRPLTRRFIRFADISEVSARTYSPMKEYGGWGIKGWSRRNIAYNISGNRGVQLVLKDGRRILVGSERAEELARVIETQRMQEERKP